MKHFFFTFLLLISAVAALAEPPALRLPVDCRLGDNCWIVNYADTDPGEDASDFMCGGLSYDAHNGTDFGLADLVAMETGVPVLAAAGGKILRMRDGVADIMPDREEQAVMLAENRGCGNGVYIDHGGGWQTIYCHMKQGSIVVRPGQDIEEGAVLGQVGHSGIAEFPHLHFGLFHEGSPVDPFTGLAGGKGCMAEGAAPLWAGAEGIAYQPVSLYAAGFKAGVPDFEAVKIDSHSPQTLPAQSEAMTFWVAFYGAVKGDLITIEIRDPQGNILARREIIQDKNRARQFYYVGRKAPPGGFAGGTYTGSVQLARPQGESAPIMRDLAKTVTVK